MDRVGWSTCNSIGKGSKFKEKKTQPDYFLHLFIYLRGKKITVTLNWDYTNFVQQKKNIQLKKMIMQKLHYAPL